MHIAMNTGRLERSGRVSAKLRYAAYDARTMPRSVAVMSELSARIAKRFARQSAARRGIRKLATGATVMLLVACPWRGELKGCAVWSYDHRRCECEGEKARVLVQQLRLGGEAL